MPFVRTTAINKILKLKKRKKVIQGGTWAGKTHGIIPVLIDDAIRTPRLKITIVAETIPAVKDGAVDIFKTVMYDTARWRDDCWVGNPLQYNFPNGSKIQFKSFDSVGKAKASGKRDKLFINEANHVPYLIADALMIRSAETYLDFNPDEEFWAHTETLTEPNSELLKLTYKDNEALPKETLEDLIIKKRKAFYDINIFDLFIESNIKSHYWANWWKVYGLGETGSLQGAIFENWALIDKVHPDAKLLGYGMDFGFSTSSTALVAVYKYDGELILDEIVYQTGLGNAETITRMKSRGVLPSSMIIADSAEPRTIHEIRKGGFNIRKIGNKTDATRAGIGILQDYRIRVTKSSINLIKEFRNYIWDTDKDGNFTGNPVKKNDHGMDAIIYFAVVKLKSGQGRYTIGYA